MNYRPTMRGASEPSGSFRGLIAWQKAVELDVAVYELTGTFPKEELFGLTSQMRRAAVSVASSIAEGYGRCTRGEYLQFLGHARGSNCELQTQLEIASRLGFGSQPELARVLEMAEEVGTTLAGLMRKLRA